MLKVFHCKSNKVKKWQTYLSYSAANAAEAYAEEYKVKKGGIVDVKGVGKFSISTVIKRQATPMSEYCVCGNFNVGIPLECMTCGKPTPKAKGC